MVRCATLSVPVIANPPVGFIVGVKVLAIPLHLPKKPVKVVSCQFGAKSVIQPVLCVIAEIEYYSVFFLVCAYCPAEIEGDAFD